jgi:putative FmdB family regulatory protein
MPTYEYHCDKCKREVSVILSIREHDRGGVRCPRCNSRALRRLMSTFLTQTAKKS